MPVATLGSLALAPDVVKIDVQGLEEMVVRGGLETFARYRPARIIEDPAPGLVTLLGDLGLHPYIFDGNSLRPHDGSWKNTLFLIDKQAALVRGA